MKKINLLGITLFVSVNFSHADIGFTRNFVCESEYYIVEGLYSRNKETSIEHNFIIFRDLDVSKEIAGYFTDDQITLRDGVIVMKVDTNFRGNHLRNSYSFNLENLTEIYLNLNLYDEAGELRFDGQLWSLKKNGDYIPADNMECKL